MKCRVFFLYLYSKSFLKYQSGKTTHPVWSKESAPWLSGLGLQTSRASPQGAQRLVWSWEGVRNQFRGSEWSPDRGAGQDEEPPCIVCSVYFEPYVVWVFCLFSALRKPLFHISLWRGKLGAWVLRRLELWERKSITPRKNGNSSSPAVTTVALSGANIWELFLGKSQSTVVHQEEQKCIFFLL